MVIGGVTLVRDQDYSVAYENNLNVGTAAVVISPASELYAGSKTADFTIVKGKTSFKVKASKKKISVSDLKKNNCIVKLKVKGLTKGSSKPAFSVKKVTNGQKSMVKVNGKTGKVTVKKDTKKCAIYVKVQSKANKNRSAGVRTVKLVVK